MPARFRALLPLLVIALVLLLFPAAAPAQSGKSVIVIQRDAEITLETNGDAKFVETWVVDFRNGRFTFAFREIPKNRLRDIVDWSVTEGDAKLSVTLDETDEKIRATWYFPETNRGEKFSSDIHTFTVRYTVQGAMRLYPDGDQFWWKFVEADRAYTIQSARVNLYLPGTFPTDQILATTYTNGAESGGARVLDGSTVQFMGGPFPSGDEWQVRAQFPHVITAAPEGWQVLDDRAAQIVAQNDLYSVVAGVVILIGGGLLLLVLWYLYGRDKPTIFNAEFLNAPPDDTPPGVVGALLDERADLQDILATVADLARRGYLIIREHDVFGTPDFERTAKPDRELVRFEQDTLDALMRGMPMRRLEDVRGSFYYHIKSLETALYDEVVARGFFPRSPLATRDLYFRIGKWGAVLVPTIGLVAYFITFALAPLALFPLFSLELFFLALLGLSRVMPQRTAQGALACAKWSAFRRYLAKIEQYTDLDAAHDQFAKYLAFAVAFGLEKSWIEKFRATSAPAPTWYIPRAPTPNDWLLLRDTDNSGSSPASEEVSSTFPASPTTPAAPIFSDAPERDRAPARPFERAPSLDQLANSSFVALNTVSGNMFEFLNTSADAFVARPETRTTSQQVSDSVGDFANWIGSSSSSSSDSSSWSGSSSSSSSSSGGGGGGGGGGSSGFG